MIDAVVVRCTFDAEPVVGVRIEDAASAATIVVISAALAAGLQLALQVAEEEGGLPACFSIGAANAGPGFATVRVVRVTRDIATLALELPLREHAEVVAAERILTAVSVVTALDAVAALAERGRRIAGGALVLTDAHAVLADVCVRSAGPFAAHDLTILD